MLRGAIGFVVAAVVWLTAFFALAALGNLLWSGYAAHVQTWAESGVFAFPPAMAVYLAACWAAADVLAGWLAVAVGRRAGAVRALAAALALYAGAIHLYLSWPDYPWWYNLAVVLPAAPAVLLGGRLGRRFLRVPAATGAH